MTKITLSKMMRKLQALELGKREEEVPEPSCLTSLKIIKSLGIPLCMVRKGVGIDALHETKANERYLSDYFDKLEDVIQRFHISEESLLSNPQVHLAVTMTCEYLESCETLSAAKRKRDEQEKEKKEKIQEWC